MFYFILFAEIRDPIFVVELETGSGTTAASRATKIKLCCTRQMKMQQHSTAAASIIKKNNNDK